MEDGRSFKIGEREFKLNKIDAFRQFHIVRRIGPLLAELIKSMQGIGNVDEKSMTEAQKLEHFAKIAAPLMEGLSRLSDADSDYVLLRLLASVEVYQSQFNVWAKVATESAVAIQDMELPMMLQIAGKALVYNLSGFFALLPRQ